MISLTAPLTSRNIKEFCEGELTSVLTAREAKAMQRSLTRLLALGQLPPRRGRGVDIAAMARSAGIDTDRLQAARKMLWPLLRALVETTVDNGVMPESDIPVRKRRGPMPRVVVEFPEPVETEWAESNEFGAALRLHARRHGESIYHLYNAVVRPEDGVNRSTLIGWGRGARMPRTVTSLEILGRIERRYRLPAGYFRRFMGNAPRAASGHALKDISPSERRRLAWHLPEDFNRRTPEEQAEILDWVRSVIISGSTEYRRYQAAAIRQRFGMRFNCAQSRRRKAGATDSDREAAVVIDAPPRLNREMAQLLSFKTSTFAAFGMQRNGIWGEETAQQKVEHFGLWFGALAASPESDVQGFGADPECLSFATMVFPQVWDWYLQWRERRRGFFTKWEVDLLVVASALCREETGWLRQTPEIAAHLDEFDGLVTRDDIAAVQADWPAACDRMYKRARRRIKEIQRVSRVHRDPFEPILTVLDTPSPVGEYRKITEEILRRMPDERRYPRPAAEAVRSFLILRLGLHTGLRQKNLRELLLCKRGDLPTPERRLEDMKRGEFRWNPREHGWEVLIPSVAFKNANSSFFGAKPFRLILPDLGGLYTQIDAYMDRHRERLIGPAEDPGTFFVKTAKMTSTNAAYCQNTFYEAWRLTIQRYGTYNPWTKRGAIKGLLPHGPHNVRDVLATHILKQTGSYEQASYAIQDTPEMVAQHYGRFLPQDKAEIAARILNQVWKAA